MFISKLKIAALVVLAVGSVATGGVLTHRVLMAAPAPESPKVPKELLVKRLDAARKVYREMMKRYQGGREQPSELFGWSARWLDAELALTEKKEDRLAALTAHLRRSREVEKQAIALAKTGKGKQLEADAATCHRIGAEIRYCQATGNVAPPAGEAAPADPAPATPKVLRELWQHRRAAVRRVYEGKTKKIRRNQGMPSEFFGWSSRWLEAELALCDKKDERIACLQAHMERTRESEQLALHEALAGVGKQSDADAATYERLGADLRYFRVTGAIPLQPDEMKSKEIREGNLVREKVEYFPAPVPKGPKELLQKRREAAKRGYQLEYERYRAGIGRLSESFGWSARWLDAELALTDKKGDHLAALTAHLDRTRMIEQIAIIYAKRGEGLQSDADAAAYDRISSDIRYFQATRKVPPPRPQVEPVLRRRER